MRTRALSLSLAASALVLSHTVLEPRVAFAGDIKGHVLSDDAVRVVVLDDAAHTVSADDDDPEVVDDAASDAGDTETYDYGDADYVAPSPYYGTIRGLVVSSGTLDDLSSGASIAAGADLEQIADMTLLRMEFELGYTSLPQADAAATTAFVSLYRDLGEFYRFRPYIGGGVGIAHVTMDTVLGSADMTTFAWHADAGLSIDWSETAMLDLGYRYTGFADIDAPGATMEDDAHAVFAGLRFRL